MLCTNCASPAFCKIIACFHTPLIKKGKKKMRKIYFCMSFTNKYPSGLAGCSCEQADLFCSQVVPLVGCERFSSPKTWTWGNVRALVPTSRPQSPAPRHHHVPADGDKCHWPPAGEGWDGTKRPSAWGQRNQICVVGVTASSWGGNGKPPLAEGHQSVGYSTLGRASTRGCPLVIFQHKPGDKIMPDGERPDQRAWL